VIYGTEYGTKTLEILAGLLQVRLKELLHAQLTTVAIFLVDLAKLCLTNSAVLILRKNIGPFLTLIILYLNNNAVLHHLEELLTHYALIETLSYFLGVKGLL